MEGAHCIVIINPVGGHQNKCGSYHEYTGECCVEWRVTVSAMENCHETGFGLCSLSSRVFSVVAMENCHETGFGLSSLSSRVFSVVEGYNHQCRDAMVNLGDIPSSVQGV